MNKRYVAIVTAIIFFIAAIGICIYPHFSPTMLSQRDTFLFSSRHTSATTTINEAPSIGAYVSYGAQEPLSAQQLADCNVATPVIDLEGNPTGARKSVAHVYDQYCYVLAGADPSTFVALDRFYGKDLNGVWIFANPSDEGELISEQITGADASTFMLIPDKNANALATEKFSGKYTKDKSHVYDYGQVIELADPQTFAIDNPPNDVTECQFDAHDASLKFYRGQIVPQVQR